MGVMSSLQSDTNEHEPKTCILLIATRGNPYGWKATVASLDKTWERLLTKIKPVIFETQEWGKWLHTKDHCGPVTLVQVKFSPIAFKNKYET